ncbi:peptidase A4 family-domain-containing protein [Xylariaceae sp. FL0255]|nr:peptidase A4 family-domain-containing protein [Xylariaceae sp. FL0255]
MKTATVAAGALFAASAMAAPNTAARWARHAERRARAERNGFMQLAETPGPQEETTYSSNWAGAVLSSGAGTYTQVQGTITVPTPTGSAGSASAWVGIDGDTCGSAILQTGVDFSIDDSGNVSYDAWYEWYPAASYDFDNFDVSAGDQIQMTVVASSTSGGTATLENLTSGQSGESSELCEQDAEWIVEDFESGGGLVTFADFDSVTFTGATAIANGNTVDTTGATVFDIQQNSQTLTDCSNSGSTVTCNYV